MVRASAWRLSGRASAPPRTWSDKADQTFKDLDPLLAFLREEFSYRGFIGLHVDDDPDLACYRARSEIDSDEQPERPDHGMSSGTHTGISAPLFTSRV
jgi:hypothetical protein